MPRKGGRRKKKAAKKVQKPVESPDKEVPEGEASELSVESSGLPAESSELQGESSGSPKSTAKIKEEPVDLYTQKLLDIAVSGPQFVRSEAAASSSTPEVDLPGSSQGATVVESSDADEENEKPGSSQGTTVVELSDVDEENEKPGSSQAVNVAESSDADEENEKRVEKTANSAPAREEEEIVCIDDASDSASGEMSRAGPSGSRKGPPSSVRSRPSSVRSRPSVRSPPSSVRSPPSVRGLHSSWRSPPSSPEIEVWNQLVDDESDESFTMEGQCVIHIEEEEEKFLKKVDIVPLEGNVGVIGCGPMAQAIIPYLIKTGHNVYAYNRHPEKFMELPFEPTVVSTPAALVEKCDVILCCISGSAAVKNVMEGEDGVLKAMDRSVGKAYVEMSSVHPQTVSAYCQKVNSRGGSYLTAQIGRTRPAAYLGCSAITASGDRETFNKCISCFAAFSSYAVYLSSIVTEAAMVSITQACIESLAIITLSDTMLATDVKRLPRETLVDILERDPRKLAMLPVAATIMIEDRPDVFIPVRHVLKNLRMAISLKRAEMGGNELLWTAVHICTQVLNQYPEAKDADISCLYKLRTPEYVNPVPK